jgi:hypothetical protein
MNTTAGPDPYYVALGKITFAASHLTECCIIFSVWLSDPGTDTEALDTKLRKASWAQSTKELRKLIKQRMTPHYQQRLLPFLDKSDRLREQRNENVHALWQVMQRADTGEFAQVLRVRKNVHAANPQVQIDSPNIDDLVRLADEIGACARELQAKFKDATDLDVKVQGWRAAHGF